MPPNKSEPAQGPEDSSSPPFLETADGKRLEMYAVLPPSIGKDPELTTDMVQEKLAGNYSEDIVNEVRQYGKPEWENTESSLDPVAEVQTFYDYNFKLPPHVHDAFNEAAQKEIASLEAMKAPTDPVLLAQIEQRRKLVEGRHAEDVRWMKHKAYYRGVQKVRAAKKELQQIMAESSEGEAAAAAAAADTTAAGQQAQQQQQKQQYRQRLNQYSENELLEAISDPSEWEQGWNASSYLQHPQVLQELRTAFASSLGLPYVSPQQQAEQDEQWEQLLAAAEALQQEEEQLEAARQAFLAKHAPYQAYTPEYLEQRRRRQQLDAHSRNKQQAFWLSLGVAVGSSVVRWWTRRANKQQQQQQRRRSAGSVQNGGNSRRSTRPPTPVMMMPEMIAE